MIQLICSDAIEAMKSLSDESVDLIIADPPYWKVVAQSWDYQWRTEEEYLEWSMRWITEAYRILRKGGSFYLFGYPRMLSYLLPPLEKMGLEFRQQIIINKGLRAVSGRATKKYKQFPNTTESIFFYIKDNKKFVKPFLLKYQEIKKISSKQINELLGMKSNGGGMWSIYTGNNICEQFPTEEVWNKLQKILDFEYPYNKIAQTFNPILGLNDVWDDIDFYKKDDKYHPTQKPLKLIRRLILASSNEHDIVLDPFVGSGTTMIACINENRGVLGIDVNPEYINITQSRINRLRETATLL